ncbi:hypothetical protein LTR78_008966 [Recurvomyces mirabilis]|uniref:histidine kinase n=1 Tax=Recurvomyces mirabilis TaxID=574656 RepID=A0AAE0TQ63_9PEZI|nr:hypothetical protein LTR78_008966 [Recurvomyces mirabilis]KAK5159767.1 hypothetical protein LTS14_001872 [Recurvomyces mirabilis]
MSSSDGGEKPSDLDPREQDQQESNGYDKKPTTRDEMSKMLSRDPSRQDIFHRDSSNNDASFPPGFLAAMKPDSEAELNPEKLRPQFKWKTHAGHDRALPGSDDIWKESRLGLPHEWPTVLQSYVRTLTSFRYPAAIYWGTDLIMLHNRSWQEAGVKSEQGQIQRDSLNADASAALSATLHGGEPKQIHSRLLLRTEAGDNDDQYVVLISPLFGDGGVVGLLAQLTPRSVAPDGSKDQRNGHTSNVGDWQQSSSPSGGPSSGDLDLSRLGQIESRGPLDEHPFFQRFADMIPSGLAVLDHRAQAVFVNQNFWQLTTHEGEDKSFMAWPQSIHPDDYVRVMDAYHQSFRSGKQSRTEFRALGAEHPWRLLLLTPLGDENLEYVSLQERGGFICSIVDISSEKGAEISERHAAKEAKERREQQERFIDMISHEIRNPLSAVLHCSEDIDEAISDESNIDLAAIQESVETINLCIQHQRNIVDDVLSFSKLDASMLTLSPKPSQPRTDLANTLKMFQPEFRKQHIDFGFRLDISYADIEIDWVLADLARMGQVLVNLITNAIKFTASAKVRNTKKITVSVGASRERPDSYPPNVVFFGTDSVAAKMDNTNKPEWGEGETIYLLVACKDSGIGISEDGQKRLFERFRQATPKTDSKYGGSGLGLNISRKLCHLHGGEIGVSSTEGDGSTFGFFFKIKRSGPPGDDEGRAAEDAENKEELRKFAEEQGADASTNVDEAELPESVKNPPIVEARDTPLFSKSKPEHRGKQLERLVTQTQTQTQKSRSGREAEPSAERDKTSSQRPTTRTKQESEEAGTKQQESSDKADGSSSETDSTKGHVLLVEDNVINQRIVFRKLKAKGYVVTTADNGQEAVDAVRKHMEEPQQEHNAFDIILMDQEMPILDGNAATKAIREIEEHSSAGRVPILGVTANVRDTQQNDMKSAGMDDVMSKPYKIQDMVDRIEKMQRRQQTNTGADE